MASTSQLNTVGWHNLDKKVQYQLLAAARVTHANAYVHTSK